MQQCGGTDAWKVGKKKKWEIKMMEQCWGTEVWKVGKESGK